MNRRFATLLIAALASLCLVSPGYAQSSKATLNALVAAQFPNNTSGAITPQVLRNVTNAIIASFQQYGGVNAQVGTTYTAQLSDYGQLVTFNNANPITVTLSPASGSFSTFNIFLKNLGAGTVTVSASPSTINSAATLALTTGQNSWLVSDGTNYQTVFSSSAAGAGDVVGPAAAIDNAIARFDGTTGKLIQNSAVIVADTTGVLSGTQGVIISGTSTGAITVQGAGGNYNFNLPGIAGASGLPLISGGGGAAPQKYAVLGVSGGGTGLVGGTSGGALFFDSTSTLSSSALLGSNQLLLGGGAGNGPFSFSCPTATTVVHGGTPPTCSQVSLSADVTGTLSLGNLTFATTAQWIANSAGRLLTTDQVWGAGTPTTLTHGVNVAVDMNAGIDFTWTLTSTPTTLLSPSNVKAGQKGIIWLTTNLNGATITLGSIWKTQGGSGITPSFTSGSVDLLSYACRTTTFCAITKAGDLR